MGAPKKNQFWRLVKNPTGRPKHFKTPKELWNKAIEYFQWVDENPLEEEKLFHFQGEVVKGTASKMRAMTLDGFCLYCGINIQTFWNYSKEEKYHEFFEVCTRIREIIREQKFTGAAADLLNPSIIARDLGLSDKQTVEVGEITKADETDW